MNEVRVGTVTFSSLAAAVAKLVKVAPNKDDIIGIIIEADKDTEQCRLSLIHIYDKVESRTGKTFQFHAKASIPFATIDKSFIHKLALGQLRQ